MKPIPNVEVIRSPDSFDGCEGDLAVIIRSEFEPAVGVTSFVDEEEPLQPLFVRYEKGHTIPNHYHPSTTRAVHVVQEVLVIQSGMLLAKFFTPSQQFVTERRLGAGDIVILLCGGHGFEVLDDAVIFEVRQGPYQGKNDKVRF